MGLDAMADAAEFQRTSCLKHKEGQHFLVFENGQPAYVSLPQEYAGSADNANLCFTQSHTSDDNTTDMCCPQESGHVHAHLHRGEITEDVLLEQCMEESGCALPVLRELSGLCQNVLPLEDLDHEHREGCGHSQIAHGDHYDWLIPLNDGSYLLSHPLVQNGLSSFIEHGRLVNRGKTLAKLKRRPKQLVDLFSYEIPTVGGYESLSQIDEDVNIDIQRMDNSKSVNRQLDENKTLMPSASVGRNVVQEGMIKVDIPAKLTDAGLCKTKLDVMGICCPSEVPLIKKLLEPLPGVEDVSVNVTAKSVVVLHDQLWVTDVQLVKALNGAHLDASIHQRGELKAGRNWPSPWCLGSGILVAIAFFHYLYSPMEWVALGAVAVGVPPLILKAFAALRKFILDINMLMLIAVSGAIALGDYLEAGSIVFLFTLAEWLESRSTEKARSAIAAVVDRAPQSATLLDGGTRVHVEDVVVGTLLSVKTGETIPIDGEVVSGRSLVDESSLTGESMLVEKEAGATVWAGTMNVSGYVTMKTAALSVDSAVARMVRLVEEAQNQRSATEMLVEKIAKYYTPAVVVSAIIIGIVPWASGVHHPYKWLYLALVLLVVACPCALVISTPVVVTCGIAEAARLGLLVKGGTYLEILGRLEVVALDKTGTLSEGQFCVSNVRPVDGISTLERILYCVTSVENKASHPLAAALVSYARLHGVDPSEDVTGFEVIAGEGVSGVVDGQNVLIGNARMAARLGWDTAAAVELLDTWSSCGETVGWIGLNGSAVGIYSVGDQLRPEAAEAVMELKTLGIQVKMLTGDSAAAAAHAHNKIGEIEVFSDLLPEDKVRIVQELKVNGIVAMVGDGINDAPALAAADVGIAMGVAGSAVAMETAPVALMTNDLRKLAAAVQLGQQCRWKIWQNIIISFLTKLLIIGLAFGGHASLWAAVLADVGTCLLVIFNSMRLLKKAKQQIGQDNCISQKLGFDKQQCRRKPHGDCCEKEELDVECSEAKPIANADLQAPAVAHKHKVRFPWLHKHHHHHHHHHHHEKKEKCEEAKSCCKDKDDQPPCCSSARCEKKVLTSRGKGHRHVTHVGGFDKTMGVTTCIEICDSDCCNDVPVAPTVKPKFTDCGSATKDCLLEGKKLHGVELMQKSRPIEAIAQCCLNASCKSSAPGALVDDPILKTGLGCCSKARCESPEACDQSFLGVRADCCSAGKLLNTALRGPDAAKVTNGWECCEKGSCEETHATTAAPRETADVSKGVGLEQASRCCVDERCEGASSPNCVSNISETGRNCGFAPSNSAKAELATKCCAGVSCKDSPGTKTPTTEADKAEDLLSIVNQGAQTERASGCCANNNCRLTGNLSVCESTSATMKCDTTSPRYCCADPSDCKSCVTPTATRF